jgi:hypothetical protein
MHGGYMEPDGDIYFDTIDKIFGYRDLFQRGDMYIGRVILTDDSDIYTYPDGKMCTYKFKIDDVQRFDQFFDANPDIYDEINSKHILPLRYIKEQNEEVCMRAVQEDGRDLKFVKIKTLEICMAAVKSDPFSLKYADEQTYEMCLLAVSRRGITIQYVKEKTPEMCMIAVMEDGWTIQHVEQTPELCMAAVKKNAHALGKIKDQTPELCMEAAKYIIRNFNGIRDPAMKEIIIQKLEKN